MINVTKQKSVYISCPRSNLTEHERAFLIDHELVLANESRERTYTPRDKKKMSPDAAIRAFYRDREAMEKADEVHMFWKYPDPDLLFDLGMAIALGKRIVLINEVERTPGKKSHSNVVLDLDEGKAVIDGDMRNNTRSFLDAGGRSTFMICPVRDAPQEVVDALREWKKKNKEREINSYYPGDETVQVDPEGGINIMRQNLRSVMAASGADVFWTGSTGSMADLGSIFALGKDVVGAAVITSEDKKAVLRPLERTPHGSYENLIIKLNEDFKQKLSVQRAAILEILSYLR